MTSPPKKNHARLIAGIVVGVLGLTGGGLAALAGTSQGKDEARSAAPGQSSAERVATAPDSGARPAAEHFTATYVSFVNEPHALSGFAVEEFVYPRYRDELLPALLDPHTEQLQRTTSGFPFPAHAGE